MEGHLHELQITLTASTGVQVVVWLEDDLFAARRADSDGPAEVCLPVDLFEVIAELAGLDLDQPAAAAEALELAADARRRLGVLGGEGDDFREGTGSSV